MKKIFLFAALASIVFASCQKEAPVASVQNEGQQEVTFAAFSKAMTKGVLDAGTFPTTRTINVAGVMKTADGQYVDFLDATPFKKVADSKWEATPKAYYPIGGKDDDFSFLAYSESSGDATFARWYGSKQVELQVYDCAENEIVYSGFKGKKGEAAQASFKRTQALVTVNIKAVGDAASGDASIIINKIGFKDVKTSGALVLTLDPRKAVTASGDAGTFVKHEWIYTAGCNCSFADMGNKYLASFNDGGDTGENEFVAYASEYQRPGVALNGTGFRLDRLFPAQTLQAKVMVVNYTLGENTYEVGLELNGDSKDAGNAGAAKALEAWNAGKHYTYTIKVNLNEITIDPKALGAWTAGSTEGQYDPDPSTT